MMTDISPEERCRAYLHQYGMKNTKTRQMVMQLLLERRGMMTAEDIYQVLIQQGQAINFSTVYRILEMFTTKGVAEKSYLPDIRKYGFALQSVGHRHRLICLRCHAVIEVEHCPLADFEAQLAKDTDFEIVGHNLEWYGYCPTCRRQMQQASSQSGEKP
ncbi:Fur family transcriptional regulator [uncultured Megasphaera sp.]|uniref:Fur family transcriptional regulator n=1 Tax=uncultured Megasphaera sp. TaxID=165188 RepID=UPI002658D727|nr:transcriptional repressor [uncultured Megasphaera sp.]